MRDSWRLVPLLALAFATGCASGARSFKSAVVPVAVAEFSSPGCDIPLGMNFRAQNASYKMIHGRKSFSLLVLDEDQKGYEVENYWKDDRGHHFAARTGTNFGRVFSFPDEVGQPGTLEFYSKFKKKTLGKHFEIVGTPKETCVMDFVAAPGAPTGTSGTPEAFEEPAPAAETPAMEAPARACIPGETRQCVGAAACAGGQSCNMEGTAFTPCDCGPVQNPDPPTPEASSSEETTQ